MKTVIKNSAQAPCLGPISSVGGAERKQKIPAITVTNAN
jgi:hypothetical protein